MSRKPIKLTDEQIVSLQSAAIYREPVGGFTVYLSVSYDLVDYNYLDDYACENFCCACCGCDCYNEYSTMYFEEEEPE